jgi:hypothetical protein
MKNQLYDEGMIAFVANDLLRVFIVRPYLSLFFKMRYRILLNQKLKNKKSNSNRAALFTTYYFRLLIFKS